MDTTFGITAPSGGYQSSFGGQKPGGFQAGFNKGPRAPKPEEIDPTLYLSAVFLGNKEAPPSVIQTMVEDAKYLESKGITIRVGGDGPIDEAVEKAVSKKELILPWKGFNEKDSPYTWAIERAHHIAKMFHSAYDNLPKGVKSILAGKARLVMGHKMMSPATIVLVWTEDGAESFREVTAKTSFAGHPIKIACAAGIRVINYGKPDASSRVRHFVETISTR